MRKSNIKVCAKCGNPRKLQSHHVFPRVHFGDGVRIVLCELHHREYEYEMQKEEGTKSNGHRMCRPKQFYLDTLIEYLTGMSL